MSIRNNDDSEIKEKILELYNIDVNGINIQCPECGNIFELNQYGEFFCKKCDRIFPEDEIRVRCGL